MIKELGIAALTALSINNTDVSITDYQNTIKSINLGKNHSFNKTTYFYLDEKEKEHLKKFGLAMLKQLKEYQVINEKVFQNNFDRWIVQEGDLAEMVVDDFLKISSEQQKGFAKVSKKYRQYPSLAKLLQETSDIHKKIYDFTMQYKVRAKEAKETSSFMTMFIGNNQQVLKALA